MNQDAIVVVAVVGITPNVAPLVDDEHFFVAAGGQPLG
jgi:hypothetical protein